MMSWLHSLFTKNKEVSVPKPVKRHLTRCQRQDVKALRDAGAEIKDLIETFGVSQSTIYRTLRS